MRGLFPQDSSEDEGMHFWEGNEVDKPAVFMYANDTALVDVIQTEGATFHLPMAVTRAHLGHLELEHNFGVMNWRAQNIKMKVNAKK